MTRSKALFLESDLSEIVAGLPPEVLNLAGKRVLLAGGGGFLGRYFLAIFSHLNKEVLKSPCTICMLDNYRVADPSLIGTLNDWGESFSADICRDPMPEGDFDIIIHLAGNSLPSKSVDDPVYDMNLNIGGTLNLLEVCRNRKIDLLLFSSFLLFAFPVNSSF